MQGSSEREDDDGSGPFEVKGPEKATNLMAKSNNEPQLQQPGYNSVAHHIWTSTSVFSV